MTIVHKVAIFAILACVWSAGQCEAQVQTTEFYRSQNSISRGSGYRFSDRGSILGGSNVSPYLALTNLGQAGNGVDPSMNYFTSVRPRLEQQQQSMMQRQQFQNLQKQVSQIQSQSMTQRGDGRRRSTGHPTRFHSYLNYYPGLGGGR